MLRLSAGLRADVDVADLGSVPRAPMDATSAW